MHTLLHPVWYDITYPLLNFNGATFLAITHVLLPLLLSLLLLLFVLLLILFRFRYVELEFGI